MSKSVVSLCLNINAHDFYQGVLTAHDFYQGGDLFAIVFWNSFVTERKKKKRKKEGTRMLAVAWMARKRRMAVMVLMQLTAGIVVVVSVAPFQHCMAFLFDDSAQGYLLRLNPCFPCLVFHSANPVRLASNTQWWSASTCQELPRALSGRTSLSRSRCRPWSLAKANCSSTTTNCRFASPAK